MTYKLYRCGQRRKLSFLVSSKDFNGLSLRASIEADTMFTWKQRGNILYGYRTWDNPDPEFAISTHP